MVVSALMPIALLIGAISLLGASFREIAVRKALRAQEAERARESALE